MGFSLSGGPFQYNRFEVSEGKGASDPEKMKEAVDKAGKKAKAKGKSYAAVDKKEEEKEEEDTATGNGGGESVSEGTVAPAENLVRRKVSQLNNDTKAKAEAKVMEQDQRMAMYARALGVMGKNYSPLSEEKKELPDFIKKKMKDKHDEAHDKDDDEDKKDKKKEMKEGAKPDFPDVDQDGDTKEPISKATKELQAKAGGKKMKKEDVQITKQDVVEYLVAEGYATNVVSAEILHTHVSDEFLEEIERRMIAEMGPAYPSETKAQAKAQSDHREGKSSAGLKTGKNPGLKMSHSSGANKQA